MPRPKNFKVFTETSPIPDRRAAIDEVTTGIDQFLEWANRARMGETTLPAALHANDALTAFSEGRFNVRAVGVSQWAWLAGRNILGFVRDGHWHLRTCPTCNRWLLAKHARKCRCRRPECVRLAAAQRQARQRRKIQLEDEQFRPRHKYRHRAAR